MGVEANEVLDFRGGIPTGVRFLRASGAEEPDPDGKWRRFAPDVARLRGGVIVEAEAINRIVHAIDLRHRSWLVEGGARMQWRTDLQAPDGSYGVSELGRAPDNALARIFATLVDVDTDRWTCASLWVRSPAGRGTWTARVRDQHTGARIERTFEVDEQWRRVGLPRYWEARDRGEKRFYLLDADGAQRGQSGEASPILVWGLQFEFGREPTSLIRTAGKSRTRAADELIVTTAGISASGGRLRIVMPEGASRSAFVVDAHESDGLQIGYSESGWLMARIGGVPVAGHANVLSDTHVELQWSGAGVMLSSGSDWGSLQVRAASRLPPAHVKNGKDERLEVRLGASMGGTNALARPIAAFSIDRTVGTLAMPTLPSFVPRSYRPSFIEEFDNPDVRRINENATGGGPEGHAWRSRYRHPRKDVINREKQIYMDRDFAGTGVIPLGIDPFSIKDGVLSIRAQAVDADTVSPRIWGYRYASGVITSEYTHWQRYGYFEISAKLPRGTGIWPTFWLLPKSGEWPPEIDIMECSGNRPMSVHHSVIIAKPPAPENHSIWIDGLIDISDAFHCYALEWTEKSFTFFVDGRMTHQVPNQSLHTEMYLLANLALGSHDPNWIPDPDSTTPLPAVMEIDAIRAYSRT